MNCKPGDLAVIVDATGRPEYLGRLLEVLSAPPVGVPFRLPDGTLHIPVGPDTWVCKFAGSTVQVGEWKRGVLHFRDTLCAVVDDFRLRPIRPDDECDTVAADKPLEVHA